MNKSPQFYVWLPQRSRARRGLPVKNKGKKILPGRQIFPGPKLCLLFPAYAGFSPFIPTKKNPPAKRGRNHVAKKITFRKTDRKSTRLNSSHVKISYAVF